MQTVKNPAEREKMKNRMLLIQRIRRIYDEIEGNPNV
jgi:hypothetical protein